MPRHSAISSSVHAQQTPPFAWYHYGVGGNGNERNGGEAIVKDDGKGSACWAWGRFLSVDPLARKNVRESPYVFAVNSPLMYGDPDGQDTVIMNRRRLWGQGDDNTSVFKVTFTYVENGVSSTILGSDYQPKTMYMISRTSSDAKPGNEILEDQTLVFQVRNKRLQEDGTPEQGHENEIFLKESTGGRGQFIHPGKDWTWFDGCMGLCTFIQHDNPTYIDLEDSMDALQEVRNIYDKYEDKLTGEKFILRPNSDSGEHLQKAIDAINEAGGVKN